MIVINENTIKQALNESIEEFLVEEGWLDKMKNAYNNWSGSKYLNSFGKSLKNGISMYMDAKTNGRWNRQYGDYVNGNTKMGELFYLNKWFNYYTEKLNSIIYNANIPDQRDEYDEFRIDKKTGDKIGKIRRYDYVGRDGAIIYAQKYCTKENFNNYIKNISPDRESVAQINNYIINYITKYANDGNLNGVLKGLNIYTFYGSKEGQYYLMMNRENQQNRVKNTRLKRNIPQVQEWIRGFKNNDKWEKAINYINKSWKDSPFKRWIITVLKNNPNTTPNDMANFITYDNFIRNKV